LSRGGEAWTIPLLPSVDGPFPLLDRVRAIPALYTDDEREVYATLPNPEIDAGKLMHFALGMFWKASVHSWKSSSDTPHIDLGPYREFLRRYLLGEEALPDDVALVVSLDNAPVRLIGFVSPYKADGGDFEKHLCFVPGMLMALVTGYGAQEALNILSLNGSPTQNVQVEELSQLMRNVSRSVVKNARRTRKLDETNAEIEARGLGIRFGG
jgi:hypothetical protein